MGTHTDFFGSFEINKQLDVDTLTLLQKLNDTRRMKRKLDAKFGIDGEFYVEDNNNGIVDINRPPSTQPGLWCQWRPNENGTEIEWDENEKFYNYVEWLQYIVDKILKPRGYFLTGEVEYNGDNGRGRGYIIATEDDIIDSLFSQEEIRYFRKKKEENTSTQTELERLRKVEKKYNALVSLLQQKELTRLHKHLFGNDGDEKTLAELKSYLKTIV